MGKTLTAKEAKSISENNFENYDEIIQLIEHAAKGGVTKIILFRGIKKHVENQLMNDGFLLGKGQDNNGVDYNIISWK